MEYCSIINYLSMHIITDIIISLIILIIFTQINLPSVLQQHLFSSLMRVSYFFSFEKLFDLDICHNRRKKDYHYFPNLKTSFVFI